MKKYLKIAMLVGLGLALGACITGRDQSERRDRPSPPTEARSAHGRYCQKLGYEPGTPEFKECILRRIEDRRAARERETELRREKLERRREMEEERTRRAEERLERERIRQQRTEQERIRREREAVLRRERAQRAEEERRHRIMKKKKLYEQQQRRR